MSTVHYRRSLVNSLFTSIWVKVRCASCAARCWEVYGCGWEVYRAQLVRKSIVKVSLASCAVHCKEVYGSGPLCTVCSPLKESHCFYGWNNYCTTTIKCSVMIFDSIRAALCFLENSYQYEGQCLSQFDPL